MPSITGKEVGSIGYGLMGLTWRAAPPSEEQAFRAMRAALASGCNFWNGGEFYGPPDANSLVLLNKYYAKYPEDADKVVLSIKGGLAPNLAPDGSVENIQRSVNDSLAALGPKGKIDVFEMARVDTSTPLEVTFGELDKYVKAGKIGGIALSEVGAATVRKAASITKIVAVEVELSLWATEPLTNGVAAACAEFDIPIVAYSPIGRGMLSGDIRSADDIPADDLRKTLPRFQPEAFEVNIKLVKELEAIAKERGCTPAQLAISWVRSLSKKDGNPTIIPIPGASTEERVLENAKAIELDSAILAKIETILSTAEIQGGRYGGHLATMCEL